MPAFNMGPRLPKTPSRLFICPSCQLRPRPPTRFISTTPATLASPETPQTDLEYSPDLPKVIPKYTRLTSRNLIKLTNGDAGKFLHDLLPAKILDRAPDAGSAPIYTTFLNAHGRVLQDVFIYPPSGEQEGNKAWFIEVDADSSGLLMQHLRKHKLRSKFTLERIPQEALGVYYLWPRDMGGDGANHIGGPDPRPGMGSRWIMEPERASADIEDMVGGKSAEVSLRDYTIHRILNGIAEGQSELVGMSALPMEGNIDFFGGIDFHKGCYVGQELTIRTHHTGVVRKRIMPCQIYDERYPVEKNQELPVYIGDTNLPAPPSESNITKASARGKGRSIGKWLNGVGNIGLALCRLEIVTDIQLTGEGTHYDPNEEFKVGWEPDENGKPTKEVKVKPIMLPWLRKEIMESIERRQRKPKKDEAEEEVE